MNNLGQFKKGLIYGFGIDDTDYQKERRAYSGNTSKVVWYCDTYSRWKNMLKRCYSQAESCYDDVSVCEEWKYFSRYKAWFDVQIKPDGEFDVDKDLLDGISRLYSPDTCCVIPRKLNLSLSVSPESKGLTGTYYEKERGKYQSYCNSFLGKRIILGRYDTDKEAHRKWQVEKIKQINKSIEWYISLGNPDIRVVGALNRIIKKVEVEISEYRDTLSLKTGGCYDYK